MDPTSPFLHQVNPEIRLTLQHSMLLLQQETLAQSITFWGKIQGTDADYYVVQLWGNNPLCDKRSYYSTDGRSWAMLPTPDAKVVEASDWVTTFFTGDPAYEFEQYNPLHPPNRGDVEAANRNAVRIREEERLATAVQRIDFATALVPRTAYVFRPDGTVARNPSFRGLTSKEARSYLHWCYLRSPQYAETKRTAFNAKLDPLYDYFDRLCDIYPSQKPEPTSPWMFSVNEFESLACEELTLTSLEWPGARVYHRVGTPSYGRIFIGTGLRNRDLPFMMPSKPLKHMIVTPAPKLTLRTNFQQITNGKPAEEKKEGENDTSATVAEE